MKPTPILLVVLLSLICPVAFAQTQNQTPSWLHPLIAAQTHEHEHTWCGNHIFDPAKPKGLSDWAQLQLKNSSKKKTDDFTKGNASVSESEPNNSFAGGNFVDLSLNSATVTGNRTLPVSFPTPVSISIAENNDSIGTAKPLNLIQGQTNGVRTNVQAIGDGQFGQTSGDFDFYSFNADIGDLFLFDITSDGILDSLVGIYDSNGNLIRAQDDESRGKADPYLKWTPEVNGTYYLCVAGLSQNQLTANFPSNPFQSGTGPGALFTGQYVLTAYRLTPVFLAFEPNGSLFEPILIIDTQNIQTEFFIFGLIDSAPFSGDFDMFAFNAAAGQTFDFEVITPDPTGSSGLDPVLGIYDTNGNVIAARGDTNKEGGDLDTSLLFTAPTAGYYGLVIGAQAVDDPAAQIGLPDPFTGIGGGVTSTGFYTIVVSTRNEDKDFLTFDLEQGDVFSARAIGGLTGFGAIRPDSSALAYTAQNVNAFSAPGSPFPVGDASLSFVAPETGRYGIEIFSFGSLIGSAPWQVDMLISEPGMRSKEEGTRQIVFVDFNGATVDATVLSGENPAAVLSPLSTFLPKWGIPANQESLLIDRILEVMEENLITDLGAKGGNGNFDVSGVNGEFALTLLNSRDHADPWGQPNVSRVIIGGTVAQLGVPTIGIAQSIDPGNYATEETAVVLLDALSEPAPTNGDPSDSLLQFSLVGGATIIDLVGIGVGNIASHEIGHYVGNWHTVNNNEQPNIMDQGGFIKRTVGVGPDENFGSLDDIDVDFEEDAYTQGEVYPVGRENTIQATSFGLSTGTVQAPEIINDRWLIY